MKILFFTRRYHPEIGGVETHVREITERLLALGHEVTIVTEKPLSSQLSLSDTSVGDATHPTVMRIPVGKNERLKKFTIWRWIYAHRDLIKNADVIHCHDVFYWYMPFRLLFPQKKVYTTFHGYETVVPPEKKAIRMRMIAARMCRGNIAVGDFIKKWYGTHPTYVTYGGVKRMNNDEKLMTKSGGKLNILFVGRMEEDTGSEMYMELLSMLQKNKVEYTFIGLGEGPMREAFGAYGQTPGLVTNVSDYVRQADVLFASSYLSILQGLVSGKLIVSLYDNPLKKDYLLMTPFKDWIIARDKVQDAYKDIKHFILNPNRLKKQIEDETAWASHQTWDQVTDLYLKLWRK